MPPFPRYAKAVKVAPVAKAVFAVALTAIAWSAAPPRAAAQNWPARPITIVIPFGGGGIMDFAIRSIAQELTQEFGQPFVIESRPGGGGLVGTAAVAKAEPDGYTLLVTAIGPVVFRPLLEAGGVADAGRDMTPIVMIGETPNAVLASPKLGVNTVKELIAYARAHDNRLSIGHPGAGTMGELCGVALAAKVNIDGNMIAYRGAAQIITDLLGGQIDIGTPAYGPGSDAVKIVAVGGSERLASLPAVPTLKESGVDLECSTWLAIYGPAGLPRAIVDKLNGAINAYLVRPDTRKAFASAGFRPLGGTPESLRDRVIADRAVWAPIVGIRRDPAKSEPGK